MTAATTPRSRPERPRTRDCADPATAPVNAGSGLGEARDSVEEVLGPEAYRAMYDHSPDGVLFTAPDGRVFAASPAARQILRLSESEICARGRQGLADHSDERWGALLAERERTGHVRGVARMLRGDGVPIEVDISAQVFTDPNGEERTCTIVRDVSERVAMERQIVAMSARLRELTLTDELTGLRNRRGFLAAGAPLLEMADRERSTAHLLFVDVDNMKELNDCGGHAAGDAGLRAVATAISGALRGSDVVSRIGGDEFVALMLGLDDSECDAIERRIREDLGAGPVIAASGKAISVSAGWAARDPSASTTLDDLLLEADRAMYRAKSAKRDRRRARAGRR